MERGYQHDFSAKGTAMFNIAERQHKAKTMIAVLKDYFDKDLGALSALNVGGSTGIIDDFLSEYFSHVVGIDIDDKAISYAMNNYKRENLTFEIGDAMNLHYDSDTFDVLICSQVYEHVPDSKVMMSEIYRVLKPGGVCYFSAGNRLMWNEPHYNLPLLSVIPHYLANRYLRLTRKGSHYYEKHLSYWGLKKLVKNFEITDYTRTIILNPTKFHAEYMIKPKSIKAKVAALISKYFIYLTPGYIWILKKPNK